MSVIRRLAEKAPSVPGAVRLLSHVPFSWRKGPRFTVFSKQVRSFESWSPVAQRKWVFARVRNLVAHAEREVPFYRALYHEMGFSARDLKEFADLESIPVVNKRMMQAVALEERCARGVEAVDSNTGGTTGQPLTFRVERSLTDKEWAYMYSQWERRGWAPGFLKLRFGGANLGARPLLYVPTEGEFLVNTYLEPDITCRAIAGLLRRWPIYYLHGYPSAVAAFARNAYEGFRKEVVDRIRPRLRGVLLGSEFPAPIYREQIEEVFGPTTFSWYGHSEKAVLAGEKEEPFVYYPFQSYGWTEAVSREGEGGSRLIGTNLDGYACPFIRYDTGDLVEPLAEEGGLLVSFRVTDGRIGDTVLDRNGGEISLTALIFGRHHGVFGMASHVQVAQREPGEVLLLVSGFPESQDREVRFWRGFDASGVSMRFRVRFLSEPVRTASGKVALKVPYAYI